MKENRTNKGKIFIIAALCMMVFAQYAMPVKAVEARYVACVKCGGRIYSGESFRIEASEPTFPCSKREGCVWRNGIRKVYKAQKCTSGCSLDGHVADYTPIRTEKVRVHIYCPTEKIE